MKIYFCKLVPRLQRNKNVVHVNVYILSLIVSVIFSHSNCILIFTNLNIQNFTHIFLHIDSLTFLYLQIDNYN
jgi:hypothetical protein